MNNYLLYLPTRRIAIQLFKQFEGHVLSPQFHQKLSITQYLQQYNWVCYHFWLLRIKIQSLGFFHRIRYPFLIRSLNYCMEEFTKEHVFVYEDYMDKDVFDELQRRKKTLIFSLNDYYVYNFQKKSLDQIIKEDLGCQSQLTQLYLDKNWKRTISPENIVERKINWDLP